jgi:hypothetical protein
MKAWNKPPNGLPLSRAASIDWEGSRDEMVSKIGPILLAAQRRRLECGVGPIVDGRV